MIYFKLGKPYAPTAEHNTESMMKVVYAFYLAQHYPCLSFRKLVVAIGHHPKGGGSSGFIRYLAKRGYLIETNARGRKL